MSDEWLARIQRTMAVDISRFQSAQAPPAGIVKRLFDIPEVEEAFHLLRNRRSPLSLDPSSRAEKQEIVDAIERVVAWLDNGFHEKLVEELRAIAGELLVDHQ